MTDYVKEYNAIVDAIEKSEKGTRPMPWLIGWLTAGIKNNDYDYEMAFKLIEELVMETELIK